VNTAASWLVQQTQYSSYIKPSSGFRNLGSESYTG